MGTVPSGLAAFIAKKKSSMTMTPASQAAPTEPTAPTGGAPMMPMTPPMVHAIKKSKAGHLPPGLMKYLAAKKATKGGK